MPYLVSISGVGLEAPAFFAGFFLWRLGLGVVGSSSALPFGSVSAAATPFLRRLVGVFVLGVDAGTAMPSVGAAASPVETDEDASSSPGFFSKRAFLAARSMVLAEAPFL